MLIMLLQIITLFASAQATCDPPDCFLNNGEATFCTQCPKGYGVAVENGELMECKSDPNPRNTKCIPCSRGVNYSDVVSASEKCMRCNQCNPQRQDVSQNCTVEQNFDCVCKSGQYYYDEYAKSCFLCTPCLTHEIETTECTPDRNRECSPRPSTTPPRSSTTPPRSSTAPPSLPVSDGMTTVIANSGPNLHPTGVPSGSSSSAPKHLYVIGIIVPIPLIAVILCILVKKRKCLKQWWQERRTARHGSAMNICCNCVCIGDQNFTQKSAYTIADQTPSPTLGNGHVPRGIGMAGLPHCNEDCNGQTSPVRVDGAASPLMAVDGRHCGGGTPTAPPYETVFPHHKRQTLIEMLDAPDVENRDAAKMGDLYLNVTQAELDRWRRTGSVAQHLLSKWEEDGKTLDHFIACLRDMDRDDIADFLDEQQNNEQQRRNSSDEETSLS